MNTSINKIKKNPKTITTFYYGFLLVCGGSRGSGVKELAKLHLTQFLDFSFVTFKALNLDKSVEMFCAYLISLKHKVIRIYSCATL